MQGESCKSSKEKRPNVAQSNNPISPTLPQDSTSLNILARLQSNSPEIPLTQPAPEPGSYPGFSACFPPMTDSAAADAANPAPEEPSPPPLSGATTNDVPAFGWSSYAERINGRFAMVGMVVMVAIELCTGSTVVHWLGLG